MLEIKSLLLGLVFAFGAFAVKTGAGVTYLVMRRSSLVERVAIVALVAAVYLGLFVVSYEVCARIDTVFYFNKLRALFQSGMALHLLVAVGMLMWGYSLLRGSRDRSETKSAGWLALVIPCPVCGSVVFITTGFLVNFFPDRAFVALVGAYAVFIGLVVLTVCLLLGFLRRDVAPVRLLGFSMLFIASYFLVSVILAPHVADLDKVYRIAAATSSAADFDMGRLIELAVPAIVAVSVGFVTQWRNQRRA